MAKTYNYAKNLSGPVMLTPSFWVQTDVKGQSFQGNRDLIFSLLDCRDFGEKDIKSPLK